MLFFLLLDVDCVSTTRVSFFPKYSVVNKEEKRDRRGDRSQGTVAQKETREEEEERKKQEVKKLT